MKMERPEMKMLKSSNIKIWFTLWYKKKSPKRCFKDIFYCWSQSTWENKTEIWTSELNNGCGLFELYPFRGMLRGLLSNTEKTWYGPITWLYNGNVVNLIAIELRLFKTRPIFFIRQIIFYMKKSYRYD